MVFGQELAGSIRQLGGPGIQATQVQFIKQFTMSLPHSQSGGMVILGLISPFQQLHFFKGFGTGNVATTLATGVFFWRLCEYAMLFLTTTFAFLLPCLNLVYMFCTVWPCGKEPSSVHKACTMMLMHSPV